MPGHDHSITGNMVAGDLNSHEALWLWNCPVSNEELEIYGITLMSTYYLHSFLA